jgi:DNA-binding transcriptional regulator GbsR (MarR family)
MVELNESEEKFVLHWGEIGNQWGVNRSEAQIHALLFIVEDPLPADEISELLGISRSNVSMSLKSLRNRDLARSVQKMGERKEFFTTNKDVWETFKILAQERRNKHLQSTREVVSECLDGMSEGRHAHDQLEDFQEFLNAAADWFNALEETGVDTLKEAVREMEES